MENRKIKNKILSTLRAPLHARSSHCAQRHTLRAARLTGWEVYPTHWATRPVRRLTPGYKPFFLTPSRGHNQRVGLRKSFKIGRFLAAGCLDTCSKRVTIRGRHSRALQLLWRELQGSDSEGSLGEMRRQAQADYDQVQKSDLWKFVFQNFTLFRTRSGWRTSWTRKFPSTSPQAATKVIKNEDHRSFSNRLPVSVPRYTREWRWKAWAVTSRRSGRKTAVTSPTTWRKNWNFEAVLM